MAQVNQPSFTGGELKPSIHGRVEISKYGVGCQVLRNFVIHAGGGVSNRGGFRYLAKAKYDDKNTILVPFQFSQTQTYMLEFGDLYMRVWKDGGLVLNTAKNITDITNASVATFTSAAHGFTVGTWVFIASVVGMTPLNGRFFIVSGVSTNTFTLTDLFGNAVNSSNYPAYVSGGTVSSVYEVATPYAHGDLVSAYEVPGVSAEKIGLDFTQSADVLTICGEGYETRELTRTGHTAWTFSVPTYAPNIAAPTGVSLSGPAASGGTATFNYIVTAIDSETGEESVGSTAATTAVGKIADTWVAADYIDISWTAVSGASKYNVYKDKNGYYGFIGPATGTTFRDDNMEPLADDAPPEARNPFSGAGNYPGAVALHEQRRVFARTANNPDTTYMSQTANYRNMNVSVPAKDSDALTFTIASEQVNAIKYLLSVGDLLAFTGNGEWVFAGANDSALSPSTISAKRQTGRGIAPVKPILIGDTALLVQARGKKVRDLRYTLESDGYNGNDVSILSSHLFKKTRSADKRVRWWTYQQEPDSLVWSCHNDGSFTSLTYQREHEVWGFARHDTDGKVMWFSSVPEGDKDVVYAVVKRTINGVERQLIEILESRDVEEEELEYAFFVDSGVQFEGNTGTVLYGLEHLEGVEVSVLADGNHLPGHTVSGGTLTLPDVYSTIAVGRAYVSDIQPMDIEMELKSGSTRGRGKHIPAVFLQVYASRGMKAGPSFDELSELRGERTDELMGEATRLRTGTFRIGIKSTWKTGAAVCIRHDYPLPCTILSIAPDVEVAS